MHPDDPSGHVIDLGVDGGHASVPSMVMKDESDEFDEQPIIYGNNIKKIDESISQVFAKNFFRSSMKTCLFFFSRK